MTRSENLAYSMGLVRGEPSRRLLWTRWFEGITNRHGPWNPDLDTATAMMEEVHCLVPYVRVRPYREYNDGVVVRRSASGDGYETVEYRSARGALSERLRDGQILRFRVAGPDDLSVFIEQTAAMRVEPNDAVLAEARDLAADRCALAFGADISPVFKMLQFETGVAGFYYLLEDAPELMVEAMETMQTKQRDRYRILASFAGDLILQGENTSTSMISPDLYERYNLPQIREYCETAHASGKIEIVHMCGTLRDLLGILPSTGMDGVHALTPPPDGDVDFGAMYDSLPGRFIVIGRLNGVHWVGKSRNEIVGELERLLPRRVFEDHPFLLLAHGAGMVIDPKVDWQNLSAAVAEYGGAG